MSGVWRSLRQDAVLWPLAALVALVAFNLLFTPGFARIEVRDGRLYGSLIDVLQNGSPVFLLSIGMTLVIATAGIDLSVGSTMALCGAVAALLMTDGRQPVPIAIAAGLLVAALVGVVNGVLVTGVGLQPIVATLMTLVMGRGLAQALTQDQKVRFSEPAFEFLANGSILGLPAPVFPVAAAALVVVIVLRKTALGMYITAVGTNLAAARLCGLRIHAIRIAIYVFCGLCAGLAGLIAAADIREADVANCGLYLELDAILAVVIGGTSLAGGRPRIIGALIGAALLQLLTIMLQMRGVITEHTLIIKALAVLAVTALQSPGLWRTRAAV
jgi:simple sugar transport system permease protein